MNTRAQTPLIIIMGPTGVGKSDFALKLAEELGGEIINCDVGQLYTPLAIGTAKPDWRHAPLPHHLFDILSEPRNFSVTEFRARVEQLLQEVRSREHVPILVGGSGFYVQGLFFPPIENEVIAPRAPAANSWQALNAIDPLRAQQIHPHDHYRIERALTIWRETGRVPSTCAPVFNPVSDNFILVHVERDREELYARINERTHAMLKQGWLEEVAAIPGWYAFLRTKRLIGYPEIIDWLAEGTQDTGALCATIQQTTRRYAKRQMTFWRMLVRKLQATGHYPAESHRIVANLTLSPVDLYIRQLKKLL